jgi:hypothetical protein
MDCHVFCNSSSSIGASHCLQGFAFCLILVSTSSFPPWPSMLYEVCLNLPWIFFPSTISVMCSSFNFFPFLPWPSMLYDLLPNFFPFCLGHQCSIIFFQFFFLSTLAISVMWSSSKLFSFLLWPLVLYVFPLGFFSFLPRSSMLYDLAPIFFVFYLN